MDCDGAINPGGLVSVTPYGDVSVKKNGAREGLGFLVAAVGLAALGLCHAASAPQSPGVRVGKSLHCDAVPEALGCCGVPW